MTSRELDQMPVAPPRRAQRPLRILLTTWQDFAAGSTTSVRNLAIGLHRRGHAVCVATPGHGVLGQQLLAAGLEVADTQFPSGWSLRGARRLAALARGVGAEVVDAQESRDRKAAVLAKLWDRSLPPLIITRRQLSLSSPVSDWVYGRVADRIIAISHAAGRALTAHGVAREKIRTVHTGLDPARLSATPTPSEIAELRASLGLDPTRPTITVVARRKDQETLLRAATRLGRPLNLLFVGIARDAALATLERDLPPEIRTAYTGFVRDIMPYWALTDIKVLTTVAEGLSQALLEAQWLGIPVITADAGGTREAVGDGERGLLYPPRDALALAQCLATMLDDASLRETLRARGRPAMESHFTVDRLAERTESVYAELLGWAP